MSHQEEMTEIREQVAGSTLKKGDNSIAGQWRNSGGFSGSPMKI